MSRQQFIQYYSKFKQQSFDDKQFSSCKELYDKLNLLSNNYHKLTINIKDFYILVFKSKSLKNITKVITERELLKTSYLFDHNHNMKVYIDYFNLVIKPNHYIAE